MNEEKIQNLLLLETYNHYYRMMVFARVQRPREVVREQLMHDQINETWGEKYCPLCRYKSDNHGATSPCSQYCFITTRTKRCSDSMSMWSYLCHSKTWGQWKIAASQIMYWLEANRP